MERDAESHSSDKEIDRICDAFETTWRSDPRPSISDFVARGTEAQQAKLFYELLLVELECRRNVGEQPSREEYLRAYPKFSSQIEGVNFHYGASAFAAEDGGAQEPTPANSPQVGTLINHFQLVQQLGSGAMGEVWKAWDTRLRRAVAVKLPRANLLSEAELRRFQREGQAASQLKHPQLASVLDIGRWGGSPYIVVEYVEGENLRQFLDSHQLTFQVMAEICADVAEALNHAHERNIVHRDLKPANIIVDPHGRAHVIDFGLAKWSTEDRDVTIHGELLGTPAYMSPELASGQGASAGPATDIYSLGVILYEMLTGSCPFRGDRSFVLHQILSAEPTTPRRVTKKIPHLNKKVPRDLETICLKSLEKDPQRRYTTIQEMAVDLRRFSRGEPILVRRAGIAERSWRAARRRPAILTAGALALVALVAIMVASSLAVKNLALSGYQEISITTEPPGARIAFARLNELGELLPGQVVSSGAPTPIRTKLLPGDYFVEVVWPDGRFHQVFRHIPNSTDVARRGMDRFRVWSEGQDGTIILRAIYRPPVDVARDMNEVRDSNSDAFLVDSHDLTYGELGKRKSQYPFSRTIDPDPNNSVEPQPFDEAVTLAELLGKRLPTNREYACLARSVPSPSGAVTDEANATEPDRKNGLYSESKSTQENVAGPEVMLYAVPFVPRGALRFVRSKHPRLVTEP